MLALVLAPRAFDDLRSASRWYDSQREGLGLAFEAAFEAAAGRVCRMPLSGKAVEIPFRRITLRRFPYDVFYEFNDQRLVAVLVSHNSRDPASALARLREH